MDEITCYNCANFGEIVKFTRGTVIFKCLGAGVAIEFKHPEITCKYYKVKSKGD